MTRTVEEVKDELASVIAKAEAAGKRPAPAKLGSLRREENAALTARVEELEAKIEDLEAYRPVDDPAISTSGPAFSTGTMGGWDTKIDATFLDNPGIDPFNTDEWAFIENAIAEIEIDVRTGAQTGVMKNIYHQLDFKVKMWRKIRAIVEEVGIGNDWPQFSALGLDRSTGNPLPAAPEPVDEPETAEAPDQTDAAMPIRQVAPPADEIASFITGGKPELDPTTPLPV